MSRSDGFQVRAIGAVESPLHELGDAPLQGDEGAPAAVLAIDPAVGEGLHGLKTGDEIVVVTWLDRADRNTLRTRPRNNPNRDEQGVFTTRSPDRPNPIGLHEATVEAVDGNRIHVDHLEAIHGTPILDLKPLLRDAGRR